MKVKVKILWMKSVALPALRAEQQNPSTQQHLAFKKQIEQHVGSALDGIEVDLFDLIQVLFLVLFDFSIRPKPNVPRRLIAFIILRSIRSYSNFNIRSLFDRQFGLYIRSKADTPNPRHKCRPVVNKLVQRCTFQIRIFRSIKQCLM